MLRISILFCLCIGIVFSEVQNGILRKLVSSNKAVMEEILATQYEKVDKTFTISRVKTQSVRFPHSNKGKHHFTSNNYRNIDLEFLSPYVKPYIQSILEAFAPTSDKVKNAECRKHSKMYIDGLLSLTDWALRMLDATGKLPDGVMVGNVNSLGHFKECLSTEAPQVKPLFKGKYCLVSFQWRPNVTQAEDLVSEETTIEMSEATIEQNTASTIQQNIASTIQQNIESTIQQNTSATEENTTSIIQQNTASTIQQNIASTIQQNTASTIQQNIASTIHQKTTSATEQNTASTIQENTASATKQNIASTTEQNTLTIEQNTASAAEQNTLSEATEQDTTTSLFISTSDNKDLKIAVLRNIAGLGVDPRNLQKIFNLMPRVGLCVPSSCSEEDVEISLNNILSPLNSENDTYQVMNAFCYTKEDNTAYRSIDIAVLVLYSVIFSLIVFGTIFDVYLLYYPHLYFDESLAIRIMSKTLKSFSLVTNGKKLFGTERTSEMLGCLHGLRFISMSWVILGHSCFMALYIPWMNPDAAYDVFHDWAMHAILNATVSVDTFFLISGLLVSYILLKELDKRRKINPITFVVHRYIRLTPTYALVLAFRATLMDHIGSGPFWRLMERQSEFCRRNWWTNLLYINNYIKQNEACMLETWYLACDMHMYLISPLIIYPLWRWRRVTLATFIVVILGSLGLRGALIYDNDYPPTVMPFHSSTDYLFDFYMNTYNRVAPYFVGIIMGCIIHCTKDKAVQLKSSTVVLAWTAATATGLSVVYGMYNYIQVEYVPVKTEVSVIYGTLHRFAWSVAVAWVIFACVKGYGGFVNSLLSWKVFMPLSRLTYCSYLIHMQVQWLFHYSRKFVMVYDWYLMVYFFFGHLMVITGGAVILSLAFEAPFICFEKLIFNRGGQPTTRTENWHASRCTEEEMREVTSHSHPLNGVKVLPDEFPHCDNLGYRETEAANSVDKNKPCIGTQYEEVHGKVIPKTEL